MYPYKWATIAKNLKGRTENAVKIRFKSLTRTLERKRKREKAKESGWNDKANSSSSEETQRQSPQAAKRKSVKMGKPIKAEPGTSLRPLNGSSHSHFDNGRSSTAPRVSHDESTTLSLLDMYILPSNFIRFHYTPGASSDTSVPYLLQPNQTKPQVNPPVMNAKAIMPALVANNGEARTSVPSGRGRKSPGKQISVRFNGAEDWLNKYEMRGNGQLLQFPGCDSGAENDSSLSISVLVKDVEATRGKGFDLYIEFCLYDAEEAVKVDNILKKDEIARLLRTKENPGNRWIRCNFRSKALRTEEVVYEYTADPGQEGWFYGNHFVEHPVVEAGAVSRHSLRAYVLFPFSETGEYAQCIQIAKSPEFLIVPNSLHSRS